MRSPHCLLGLCLVTVGLLSVASPANAQQVGHPAQPSRADEALNKAQIDRITFTPEIISPNQGIVQITADFRVRATDSGASKGGKPKLFVRTTATITNSDGQVVSTIVGEQAVVFPEDADGNDTLSVTVNSSWDGSDTAGATVPDGSYQIRITGEYISRIENKAKTIERVIDRPSTTLTGSILVDSTPPPVPTLLPGENATVTVLFQATDQVTLRGIVSADTANLAVTVGAPLTILSQEIDAGQFEIVVAGVDQLSAGTNAVVAVAAEDALGNQSAPLEFTLESAPLPAFISVAAGLPPDQGFTSPQQAIDALSAFLAGAIFTQTWTIEATGTFTQGLVVVSSLKPTATNPLIIRSGSPLIFDGVQIVIQADNVVFQDAEVRNYSGDAIVVTGSNCTLDSIWAHHNGTGIVGAAGSSGSILNSIVEDNSAWGIFTSTSSISWTVSGTRAERNETGIALRALNNVLTSTIVLNNNFGAFVLLPAIVDSNVIGANASAQFEFSASAIRNGSPSLTCTNNVIYDFGQLLVPFTVLKSGTYDLRNNTFFTQGSAHVFWTVSSNAHATVNLRNNIFASGTNTFVTFFHTSSGSFAGNYTVNSDFNLIQNAFIRTQLNTGVGPTFTLAQWQAAHGQDLNSQDTDPLLADAVNGDFHLRSQLGRFDPSANGGAGGFVFNDTTTSPAIDAGDPSFPVGEELLPNGSRIIDSIFAKGTRQGCR